MLWEFVYPSSTSVTVDIYYFSCTAPCSLLQSEDMYNVYCTSLLNSVNNNNCAESDSCHNNSILQEFSKCCRFNEIFNMEAI